MIENSQAGLNAIELTEILGLEEPLALVHDMGSGILTSVKTLFPNTADYICHYHFLSDIVTDLFGTENSILKKSMAKYKIKGQFRQAVKELKI